MATDKQVKSQNKTSIVVAIIGFVGVIVAGLFHAHASRMKDDDKATTISNPVVIINNPQDQSTVIGNNDGTVIVNPPVMKDLVCDSIKSTAISISLKITEKIMRTKDENKIILFKVRKKSLEDISRYDCPEINHRKNNIHVIIENTKKELIDE